MFFEKQKISGVFLIKPNSFNDKRGVFRRHFCKRAVDVKKSSADGTSSKAGESRSD